MYSISFRIRKRAAIPKPVINIGSGKWTFHADDKTTVTKKMHASPALSKRGFFTAMYAPKKKKGSWLIKLLLTKKYFNPGSIVA